MFKLLKEVFRTGNATVGYPFAPLPASEGFRGKPHYDPERCIACGACTVACPANALSMETDIAAGTRTWEICFGRCIFCGRCEEVCPTQAIVLSPEYELAVMNRADLYQTAEFRLAPCRVCGTPFAPKKEIEYAVAVLSQSAPAAGEELRARLETCPACKRAAQAVKDAVFGTWLKDQALERETDFGTPPSKAAHRVSLTIDGIAVHVPEGTSIMRAALEAGIAIPKLCATESERPFGSCRVCLVEIEGRGGTPASCTTPVAEGIAVHTQSDHLQRIRRGVMELYISDHPLDCRVCYKNGFCELEDTAQAIGIHDTRFGYGGANHLRAPMDESNPYFAFNPAKCIVCSRCVRACDEVEGAFALTLSDRGFASQVAAGVEGSFRVSECVSCGACVQACPTAALTEKPMIADGAPQRAVITTCTECGVGCSFSAELRGDRLIRMVPRRNGHAGPGHACLKGRFADAAPAGRVLRPMIRESTGDPWREVSWDEALGRAASEFRRIQKTYGQGAIAGVTSPRCTNEETFLVHKLVHGGIDSDDEARLSRFATGYGSHNGFDAAAASQDFESVEQADVIVLAGTDPSQSHPVFAARIGRRVRSGARLIVIDPHRIALARAPHVAAEYHLALKPGTDLAVLTAMAHVIVRENLVKTGFVGEHCEGFEAWSAFVSEPRNSPEAAEKISGVPAATIRAAARLYATGGNGAIYYGLGITEQSQGALAIKAFANLAMATGNVGRPGVGVNPLRSQNRLQGSNDLMSLRHGFPDYRRVSDDASRAASESAWRAALEAWPELRISNLLDTTLDGSFKALYVEGEEIVRSGADNRQLASRLAAMECVVVHDVSLNETARFAHVFLPASTFLEKDGTFTNVERRISRVRTVVAPKSGRADWEITRDLARAMGHSMRYRAPSEIMDEIARTTPSFAGMSYARLETSDSLPWPADDEAPSKKLGSLDRKVRFVIAE